MGEEKKHSPTFTSPPAGLCFTLASDPTFGDAFSLKSNFSTGI